MGEVPERRVAHRELLQRHAGCVGMARVGAGGDEAAHQRPRAVDAPRRRQRQAADQRAVEAAAAELEVAAGPALGQVDLEADRRRRRSTGAIRPTTRQCAGIAGTITASGVGGTNGSGLTGASALAGTKLVDSMLAPRVGRAIAAASTGAASALQAAAGSTGPGGDEQAQSVSATAVAAKRA
jgi:hypothetical protein